MVRFEDGFIRGAKQRGEEGEYVFNRGLQLGMCIELVEIDA